MDSLDSITVPLVDTRGPAEFGPEEWFSLHEAKWVKRLSPHLYLLRLFGFDYFFILYILFLF